MTDNIPTEHQEQKRVIEWAAWHQKKYPGLELLFAIPNMAMRHISNAKAMKAEGLKKGVPDLFLPIANAWFNGLFIEMKRQKGGSLSKEQREWITRLRNQEYKVEVCKGADAAIEVLKDYLG